MDRRHRLMYRPKPTRLGWATPPSPPEAPEPPPRFNRRAVVTGAEEAAQVAAQWSREYREAHPDLSDAEHIQPEEGDQTHEDR